MFRDLAGFGVLVLVTPVFCQGFHLGVKAGVPLTQYFETGISGSLHGGATYLAATRRYTLGVSGEWRVTNSIGFEADAMYRRMGYSAAVNYFDSAQGNFQNSAIDVRGDSWDFPLQAKYRFGHSVRPYVAAGAVVRYVGPVDGRGEQTVGSLVTRTSSTTPLDTSDPSDLRKRFYPGLTAGAGVEVRAGAFHMLPEFRYTHWTANISGPGGLLRFDSNQVEVLVGVLF